MTKGKDCGAGLLVNVATEMPPEIELQLLLEMAHELYENDGATALHAYQAIGYLTAYYWEMDKGQEPQDVSVPYWIIDALGIGWMIYREAFNEGRTTTLGEAYGVEGGGQGKSKKIKDLDIEIRDIRIATKIASEVSNGATVTSAISDIANSLGLSDDTVRRVWKKLGKTAKRVIKNSSKGQNLGKS